MVRSAENAGACLHPRAQAARQRRAVPAAALLLRAACAAAATTTLTTTETLTSSATFSLPSESETITMPSSSVSITQDVTLPSATATETGTETQTASGSETVTMTRTPSETQSRTLQRHDNYTQLLQPIDFVGGQELRVRLEPTFEGGPALRHWNVSLPGTLELRVYLHNGAPIAERPSCRSLTQPGGWGTLAPLSPGDSLIGPDSGDPASDQDNPASDQDNPASDRSASPTTSPTTAAAGTPLWYRTREFGLSAAEWAEQGAGFVAAAHATFVAPDRPFFICFRHTPGSPAEFESPLAGEWQLFADSNTTEWLHQPRRAETWYYLPQPFTASQYAMIQVSTDEAWDFSLTPSACTSGNLSACGAGDSLKVVPQGHPCTYEHQGYDALSDAAYLGSHLVGEDGGWQPRALPGLVEGATAGGAAVFGTQYSNPLVDEVGWGAVYGNGTAQADATVLTRPLSRAPVARHAYAYVRLPPEAGRFEVCFSSREQRAERRAQTGWGFDSLPVWRKLRRCPSHRCGYTGTSGLPLPDSFAVVDEPFGWTLRDHSPLSWGALRVGSGSSSSTPLSRAPHRGGAAAHGGHWQPGGGDALRVLPAELFAETQTTPPQGGLVGSFVSPGCWQPAERFDAASPGPGLAGSEDLTGDPFAAAADRDDDATRTDSAFAMVRVPLRPSFVCYRLGFEQGASPDGSPRGGWRVLRWQGGDAAAAPLDWRQPVGADYPRRYPPGSGAAPHLVVGGMYDPLPPAHSCAARPGRACPPPDVLWFLNDTRAGVYVGLELTVDPPNSTVRALDAAPHDPVRGTGTALRLVSAARPCDWGGFYTEARQGLAAEVTDAGLPECNSADAETDTVNCIGSAFDGAAASITMPITVPRAAASPLRVCVRQGQWNWRTAAAAEGGGALGLVHVRPDPAAGGPEGPPTMRVWFDELRAGAEALFVITDELAGLSAAPRQPCPRPGCSASGDVLRLVPLGEPCAVTPAAWDPARADTALAPYCPAPGGDGPQLSGLPLWHCPREHASAGARQSALAAVTPPVYDGILAGDHVLFSVAAIAGTVVLPPAGVPHKVCYRQLLEGGWVTLNASVRTAEHHGVSVLSPDPARRLLGGSLQRFLLRFPYAVSAVTNQGWYPGADAGLRLGSVARVRASVTDPTFGWQGASHRDVGPIVRINGGDAWVQFDWRAAPWPARLVELELAPYSLYPPNATAVSGLSGFRAKLAAATGSCAGAPSGTEAAPFGSYSAAPSPGPTVSEVAFYLTVPHSYAPHWLCIYPGGPGIQPASWLRFGPYRVVDGGARWLVAPQSRPTNQGVSTVGLIRCISGSSGGAADCEHAAARQVFDTDPGGDAAKLVPRSGSCHDGSDPVGQGGGSAHVGLEGGGTAGRTDLGPSDGLSDSATLTVTLPPVHADRTAEYRVCVRTRWDVLSDRPPQERLLWAELPEAGGVPGQGIVRRPDGSRAHFSTAPSLLEGWHLAQALTPAVGFSSAESGGSAVLAHAGASTRYVSVGTGAVQEGFWLTSYPDGAVQLNGTLPSDETEFKLVLTAVAVGREPPRLGTWEWSTVPGATCAGPAAANTPHRLHRFDDELGVAAVTLQLPPAAGRYLVCFRLHPGSPWLQLQGPGGAAALVTQSPFLEFAALPGAAGLSAYDTRSLGSTLLSSWCGTGAPAGGPDCGDQNAAAGRFSNESGYWADLVTVVGDGETCPVPRPPDGGGPPAGWWRLERVSNTTAAVAPEQAPELRLPPDDGHPTGRYRVCVFKAGDLAASGSAAVSRRGVTYQLWNRGSSAVGGGTGFFHLDSLEPDSLLVTTTLRYNATKHFVVAGQGLAAAYGDLTEDVLAEGEEGGAVSSSPPLRTGAVVEFTVRPAARGAAVPTGSYAVRLLQCPPAPTWDLVECREGASPTAGGYLLVSSGGSCRREDAPDYGWGRDGLQQPLVDGAATFRVELRSSCPQSGGLPNPGCGMRFQAAFPGRGAGLAELRSAPVWLNAVPHSPDGLSVGGAEAQPGGWGAPCGPGSARCPMLECLHAAPCRVPLQARYGGPPEYAPLGSLTVEWSARDHSGAGPEAVVGGSVPLPLFLAAWPKGGGYLWEFAPRLSDGEDTGRLYFNATCGAGVSTRFAVVVRRALPAALELATVSPRDALLAAPLARAPTPVPVWHWDSTDTLPGAFPKPAPLLWAAEGSHLEALIPYEVAYRVTDSAGRAMGAGELSGWLLTVELRDALGAPLRENRALLPELDKQTGHPSPANLRTAPQFARTLPPAAPEALAEPHPALGEPAYRFWLRVLNGAGCSRFAAAAGAQGTGCTVAVELARVGRPQQVRAELRTPVRVTAAAVRVTHGAGEQTPGRAAVREGITVSVEPGTLTAEGLWLPDEFHFGDVFALVASPGPTDGITTRDGAALDDSEGAVPARHPCEALMDAHKRVIGWGAQWTLRTTRPCHLCSFTFHTTWGAGPDPTAAAGGGGLGSVQVTLYDDTALLDCGVRVEDGDEAGQAVAAAGAVPWYINAFAGSGASASALFELYAAAAGHAGRSLWPRWWARAVLGNLSAEGNASAANASGYTVEQHGAPAPPTLSARMGAGGVARFAGLRVRGPVAGLPLLLPVVVHSVGTAFAPGVPGSVEIGASAVRCEYAVPVRAVPAREPPDEPSPTLTVLRVHGAEPLCPAGAEGCDRWSAHTEQFNLTVVARLANLSALGGVGVYNATADVPTERRFECTPEGCTANSTIRSSHWDVSGSVDREPGNFSTTEYTYGAAPVTFSRGPVSVRDGFAVLTLLVHPVGVLNGQQRGSPLRDGRFGVCLSVWNEAWGAEQFLRASCVRLRLWIVPGNCNSNFLCPTPTKRVAVVGAAGLDHGPTALAPGSPFAPLPCGRGAVPVRLRVLTYYEWFGAKVVDFQTPTRYTLRHGPTGTGGAVLVDGGGFAEGRYATAAVLQRGNGVPLGPVAAALDAEGDLVAEFLFSVRDAAAAAPFHITAEDPSGRVAVPAFPANTSRSYSFAPVEEGPYPAWDIGGGPAVDEECPSKRLLAASISGYRCYRPLPAQGWTSATAAAAGVPFPLATVVRARQGGRAWSAPSSLVLVERGGQSGCGDGGIMRVFRMRPSTEADLAVHLDGALGGSFEAVDGGEGVLTGAAASVGAVPAHRGAAVVWASFSAPCQGCVLKLTLCHSAAQGEADCLSAPPDPAGPPLAERSKLSRPFNVLPQRADILHVTAQQLPPTAAPVLTGTLFAVEWATAQDFAGWALPVDAPAAVSVWAAVRPVQLTSAARRWGNGGWLAAGAAAGGACGSSAAELAAASPWGAAAPAEGNTLRFHFVRPCGKGCEVWLRYRIGSGPMVDFPLRAVARDAGTGAQLPGAVYRWQVRTCSVAWALRGLPPPAVRRGRPFTLTAVRVDALGFASWNGSDPAMLVPDPPGENGGGGVLEPSVPLTGPNGSRVFAVPGREGSAAVRLSYSRACYRCAVSFAGVRHEMAVLTDPTQFVATLVGGERERLLASGGAASVEWEFEVYGADELGDRAYALGGPAQLLLQAPYHQGPLAPLNLSVAQPRPTVLYTSDFAPSGELPVAISSGSPVVSVPRGALLVGGIPADYGGGNGSAAGLAAVRMAGHPGGGFAIAFQAGGVELPTREAGSALPPVVAWHAPADRILAYPPQLHARPGLQAVLQVFAVTTRGETDFVASALPVAGNVTASWDCSLCRAGAGACSWDAPSGAPFARGVAELPILFAAGSGSCSVRLAPPASLGGPPQVIQVNVESLDQTRWEWAPSADSRPRAAVAADGSRSAAADALAGEPVQLRLRAMVNDFHREALWTAAVAVDWRGAAPAAELVTAVPQGCFAAAAVSLSPSGAELLIEGQFEPEQPPELAVDRGCMVNASAGLPPGTVPPPPLAVTARRGAALVVVPQVNIEGVANYTGLRVPTADGELAGAAGEQITAELHVVNDRGELVAGDFRTALNCSFRSATGAPARPAGNFSCPAVAEAGVIEVSLRFSTSTRQGGGAHSPVYLTLYGALGAAVALGPLVVAVAAARLLLELRRLPAAPDADWQEWPPHAPGSGAPDFIWVTGWVFQLRVSAVDSEGNRAEQGDEPGSDALVTMAPLAIPCIGADRSKLSTGESYLSTTCMPGGDCSGAPLPGCPVATGGWDLGRAGAGALQVALTGGVRELPSVRYTGAAGADGNRFFRLNTQGLGGASFAATYGARFQRVAGLRLPGAQCERRAGRTLRCSFPAAGPGRPGGWRNATAQRLASDPTSPALLLLRAPPRAAFSITVVIADGSGAPVAADSASSVQVGAECANRTAEDFLLGLAAGVGGLQVDRPLGWNSSSVTQGAAAFEGLSFLGSCTVGRLIFTLQCSALLDTLEDCEGQRLETAWFEVGDTAVEPSPAPPILTEATHYPTAQLRLADGLRADFVDPAALQGAIERSLGSAVTSVALLWLCRVALAAIADGITPGHRSDPGSCIRVGPAPVPGRRARAQQPLGCGAEGCVAVAEVALVTEHPNDQEQAAAALAALRAAAGDPTSEMRALGLVAPGGVLSSVLPPPPRTPLPTRAPPTPLPPEPRTRPPFGTANVTITTAASGGAADLAAAATAAAAALLLSTL